MGELPAGYPAPLSVGLDRPCTNQALTHLALSRSLARQYRDRPIHLQNGEPHLSQVVIAPLPNSFEDIIIRKPRLTQVLEQDTPVVDERNRTSEDQSPQPVPALHRE